MRMNKTNYKQYDTRWAKLPYPKKPWYIKNCGCGEVAICNSIIEMDKYESYTPKTIQPYCKQYAASNGDGTYWSGIPAMMKHYGMTEVKEHATMAPLWKELAKGDRVAIYLMGSRKGGSKRVHWTSSGHFVCSVDYKYENGKHMLYVKDSNSTSSLRNGWISYEENMRNDVLKVWSGKIVTVSATSYRPSTPYTGKLPSGTVKDGSKGDDVKAVQTFLNWCDNAKLSVDGVAGNATVSAIKVFQKTYGIIVDGVFGSQSLKKANEIVKAHKPKEEAPKKTVDELAQEVLDGKWGSGDERKEKLTKAGYDYNAVQKKVNEILEAQKDPLQPWYDAMKAQYEWSKKQKYEFNDHPTVANSKEEGTCITFVAVALQRIGLLPKKKYFYLYPKTMKIAGNGADYVKKHTEIYNLSYPNKTVATLLKEGKIKKGDIIGFGNPAYHTMVFMGMSKKGHPIFNTMGHKRGLKVRYKAYENRKVNMLVRIRKV